MALKIKSDTNSEFNEDEFGCSTPLTTQGATRMPKGRIGSHASLASTRSSRASLRAERMGSQYGDMTDEAFDTMRYNVLLSKLVQEQLRKSWTTGSAGEGVFVQKNDGSYMAQPEFHSLPNQSVLMTAISRLGFPVAMTVTSPAIRAVIKQLRLQPEAWDHFPDRNFRLQMIPSVADLLKVKRHHYAVFIADCGLMLVWDNDPEVIIHRAENLERLIVEIVWKNDSGTLQFCHGSDSEVDLEKALVPEKPRFIAMQNSFMVAATLILMSAALGWNWKKLAIEVALDKDFTRIALLAYMPVQIFLGLFFMQLIVTCFMQILGPTSQCVSNSKNYSGIPPRRLQPEQQTLPHVTVQIPLYTESLAVVEPTIRSIKTAISTYEMQGGTANIFVNDDGLMIMEEHATQRRKEFYKNYDIGWVARPKHNPNPMTGESRFMRRGRFKKASNLNYALMISNLVEDRLEKIKRDKNWTQVKESIAYDECLTKVLADENCSAWAEGNIRLGDYILLVDSDTRVPEDCLLDAVSELEQSPQVAILQYSSSTLQVAHDYFENGLSFFTELVYTAIRFMVANGDIAPFVGHNAFLRWSAIQQVPYLDDDNYCKYWSESRVSEDFDMSLRLQSCGYDIRLASFTDSSFMEGVSLTVYDELSRWEKYAFGASEIMFNPLRLWSRRGPFTGTFRDFMGSNVRLSSKVTIVAYFGTYFAIGAAWPLLLVNYFLIGWFNETIDHWYVDSYQIFFSLVIVFSFLSSVSLAVLRYRLCERSLVGALYENVKYCLFLLVYFGGLSLHVSQAIMCHLVDIDMQWTTTAKEATHSNFFLELPKLFRFKTLYTFCTLATGMIILLAIEGGLVPREWLIQDFIAIWPLAFMLLCHASLPIVLNPSLMLFRW